MMFGVNAGPTSAEDVPPHTTPESWRRFVAMVRPIPGGCHLWIGPPRTDGYGQFWTPAVENGGRPRVWRSHRYAWTAWHGPIPTGSVVMHACDEPLCSPVDMGTLDEHLRLGTVAENNAEMHQRGRDAGPRRGGMVRYSTADPLHPYERSLVLHRALANGARTQAELDAALADHRRRAPTQLRLPIDHPTRVHRPVVG